MEQTTIDADMNIFPPVASFAHPTINSPISDPSPDSGYPPTSFPFPIPIPPPEKKENVVPFWLNDPNILLRPETITEIFPTQLMSFTQKLNAISRLIIYLTIIMYIYTQTFRTIVFGVISLATIAIVFMYYKTSKINEQFSSFWDTGVAAAAAAKNNAALATLDEQGKRIPNEDVVFDSSTESNPFSNVLVTDYADNTQKRPAPPSYNSNINAAILSNAMELVKNTNSDNPEIADKLFRDLGEQLVFEQSMRPFCSTANTTIPNDQEAFSDFCYGSMVSCKEGNMFACARNMASRQTLM